MSWARRVATLAVVASALVPLAASAAPMGSGRASGSFTVSAVVVRSVPVALRPGSAALEPGRAAAAAPAAQAPRRIAVPGAGAAHASAGASQSVVFIDGAPPSWILRERPARASARAALGPALARR